MSEPEHHGAVTTHGLWASGSVPRSTLEVADLREMRGPCSGYRLGWWCSLWDGHGGSCPLRPTWWNVAEHVRAHRRVRGRR